MFDGDIVQVETAIVNVRGRGVGWRPRRFGEEGRSELEGELIEDEDDADGEQRDEKPSSQARCGHMAGANATTTSTCGEGRTITMVADEGGRWTMPC